MKKFEKEIIRKRNRLEKRGQRMAMKALRSQIPEVRSIESIQGDIQLISTEPLMKFFRLYYGMAGREIGMMYFDYVSKKDEFLENRFMEDMERYALEVAGNRIVAITETSRQLLMSAASEAIQEATKNGYGVEKTKRLIEEYMNGAIKPSRARAIAQTELITASNRASITAADSTGLVFKKYWSTSGLPGIRPSHLQAEQDSVRGLDRNQPFSNGLQFPGDPSAPPEEVINCRCTVILEPINRTH